VTATATPGTTARATEVVPPAAPSLPEWPAEPAAVDPTGSAYLVVAAGSHPETHEVARRWVVQAESMAPTTMVVLDTVDDPDDRATLGEGLAAARTGLRILVAGGQYDVLRVLTLARDAGAVPAELTAFVVETSELPLYCAHCRDAHRVAGAPGDTVVCPGCARLLEIHIHHAAALGSFLASEAS